MKIKKIRIEFLIAFATLVSVFTLLRFTFMGLGEIIFLLLFLTVWSKKILNKHARKFIFTRFWLSFLLISFFGFFIEALYFNLSHSQVNQILFDFFAYIFILIVCFTIEKMYFDKIIDVVVLLKKMFWVSSSTLVALYFISFSTRTLFGFPLLYYDFFSPFADNVHQVSSFLVVFPFFALAVFSIEKRYAYKILSLLMVPILVTMALKTGSTKALMGVFIGGSVLLVFSLANALGKKYLYAILVIFLMIAVLLSGTLDYREYMIAFFVENDGSGARETLYSKGIVLGMQSPVFGFGPGPHISYNSSIETFSDSHQTLLTIFLQTGLVGVALFFMLAIKIVRVTIYNPILLAASTAILIYALGGDILRRLPIWILIIIIYYSAKELDRK